MLSAIISILGGILASSTLLIAKKPNASELIEKITPYQGWIGTVLAFWGLWGVLSSFLNISAVGLSWAIGLASAAISFIVGFLLAYGLISKHILEKNEIAKTKGVELRIKLIKYQVPAGVALIGLGVLTLITSSK